MSRLLKRLRSLPLTAAQWVAVTVGLGVLGVSAAVLAVTTEDVTQHNGLATSDAAHLRFFLDHRGRLVGIARAVTGIGAAPMLAVLAILAAAVLWWRGSRVIVAVAPTLALGVAAVLASIAKQVVSRPRPPAAMRLAAETDPSFPSGHTTDSTAFFLALALVVALFVVRRPLARCAAVAASTIVAGAVGVSRMVLGVHWPTDVLAGWALGSSVALVVVTAVAMVSWITPTTPDAVSRAILQTRVLRLLRARRTPELPAVDTGSSSGS